MSLQQAQKSKDAKKKDGDKKDGDDAKKQSPFKIPDGCFDAGKDGEPGGDGEEKGESSGRFVGGSLFDQLFGELLAEKNADADPAPVLAKLQALDETAWGELAGIVGGKNAWEPLAQLLGPGFGAQVAQKRVAPLERFVAAHEDGLCAAAEKTQQLGALQALGPFEKRFAVAALVARGTAKKLVALLGEELVTWLGSDFVEPPPLPLEDPAAALTALLPLPQATQRRVLEALRKGAAGPALTEALGNELERFTHAYYDALPRPDPRAKRLPKPALEALRRVSPAELRPLVPERLRDEAPPDGEGAAPEPEPNQLPIGGTDAKLQSMMQPLLRGSVITALQREQALVALAAMSQRELSALLGRLTLEQLGQLEVSLGPRFRRGVQELFYRPLQVALDARAPGAELADVERTALAGPLGEATPWVRELVRERIATAGSAERLSALIGAGLDDARKRELGLGEPPRVPPPPPPSLVLLPPQRRAVAKLLAKMPPGQFAALAREVRPDVLRRFAGGAGGGSDDELARALLALLPPQAALEPPPLPAEMELVQLSQLFERLLATKEGADSLPPQRGAAPPKRRKREEDEPMHDGAELDTLYRELFGQELERLNEPDDGDGPDTALPRAQKFAALPELVRRALASRLREAGAFAAVAQSMGDTFAGAVPPDDD